MPDKRILLVEDDTFTRDLYKEVLESAEYKVDVAADGKEGLAKARESKPDLVLLDLKMPVMDGMEFLKDLKENPEQGIGKIVVITNISTEEVLKEAMDLGADSYLLKADLEPNSLVEKVKKFVG